jgi:hypothetical protein
MVSSYCTVVPRLFPRLLHCDCGRHSFSDGLVDFADEGAYCVFFKIFNTAIAQGLVVTAAVIGFFGASFAINADGGIIFPVIFGAAFEGEDADAVVLDGPADRSG